MSEPIAESSIVIRPDLTGFKEDVDARVKSAVESLKPQVGVGVDTRDADTRLAELKKRLEELKNAVTQAKVTVTDDQAKAALAALDAQLQRLDRSVTKPDVTLSGVADAEVGLDKVLAKLRELSGDSPTVPVVVRSEDAQARLDAVTARIDELKSKVAEARVDVKDDDARARLSALEARLLAIGDKTARPDIDLQGIARAEADLAAVSASLDEVDGKKVSVDTSGATSQINLLLAAVTALGPALGALALGAVGSLPAMLVGAGGAAAALKLGLGGVGTALTDLQKQQAGAGQAATQQANQIASADAAIASAERGVENARRSAAQSAVTAAEQVKVAQEALTTTETQAARQQQAAAESVAKAKEQLGVTEETVAAQQQAAAQQVVAAEYSLTQANQQAAQAQQALNDARATAARQLEDMANQATDAQLRVQQDQFALMDAQAQQQQIDASSTATAEQKAKAALAVAQAQQTLLEAELASTRATQDNAAAQQKGVDGAKAVQQAAAQVAAAHHAQQQAQQALTNAQAAAVKAQVDGARQIADAERTVSDAVRAQAQVQVDSARQIEDAQRRVADAFRAQQNAAASSAAAITAAQAGLANAERQRAVAAQATSSAAQQAAQDMAKLSPAGREFVGFLQSLEPTLARIKAVAQTNLLPGLQAGIQAALPALPVLTQFLGEAAHGIGLFADGLGHIAATPAFAKVLGEAAGLMQHFGSATLAVIDGFVHLGAAFAPVISGFGKGIDGLAHQFDAWATSLGQSKGFHQFLDYLAQVGPVVIGTIGKLVGAIMAIGQVLAPMSGVLIQVVGVIADLVKQNPELAALVLVGMQLAPVIEAIGTAIGFLVANPWIALIAGIGLAFYEAYKNIQPFHDWVDKTATLIANYLSPIMHDIGRFFSDVFTGNLDDVSTHWSGLSRVVSDVVRVWHQDIEPAIVAFADLIKAVFQAVVGFIEPLWHSFGGNIGKFFTDSLDGIVKVAGDVFKVLQGVFEIATGLISGNWSKVWKGIRDTFKGLFGGIKDIAASIWQGVEDLFTRGINKVIDILDFFISKINDVLGFFHLPTMPSIPHVPESTGNGSSGPVKGGHSNQNGGGAGSWRAASGAVLPGFAPGHDSIPVLASPGEAVLRPEVTRWLGADTIHAWNASAAAGSMPRFASGGVVSGLLGNLGHGILDVTNGIGSAVGGAVGDLRGLAGKGAGAMVDAAETPARALMSSLPASMFRDIGLAVLQQLRGGVVGLISGSQGSTGGGAAGGGAPGPVSGGVAQWAGVVRQALGMLGQPDSLVNGVLALIGHESGGNPSIVNTWDSNWVAGHPSVGLMQEIAGTFAAYAGPFRNTGPFSYGVSTNPLANVYAGINYALQNYGPGMLAGGGRHDGGGHYIGYDSGGVLPPGLTTAVNASGRPEAVLTNDEWSILRAAAAGRGDTATIAALHDLTEAILTRPVYVTLDGRVIAEAVNDHRQERILHGDRRYM